MDASCRCADRQRARPLTAEGTVTAVHAEFSDILQLSTFVMFYDDVTLVAVT
jgi:hypothetical protein